MPAHPRHSRVALMDEIAYLAPRPPCLSLHFNSPSKVRKGDWDGDTSSSPTVSMRGAGRRNKKFWPQRLRAPAAKLIKG